jgi:hypothetical protein
MKTQSTPSLLVVWSLLFIGSCADTPKSENDSECRVGALSCSCTEGNACDNGLDCVSNFCVDMSGDTDGDADSDADGDTDGDGDTDTDTDGDSDSDGDADSDTDADADGDADSDGDADTDSDVDSASCVGTLTASCSDAACDRIVGCSVVTPSTCTGEVQPCSSFDDDPNGCGAQWGCEPAKNAGLCYNYYDQCGDFDQSEDCKAAGNCSWENWTCVGDLIDCGTLTTKTNCEQRLACRWADAEVNYCSGTASACNEMTADRCDAQAGCTLIQGECGGEPAACEDVPLDKCPAQPGCELVGDTDGIDIPPDDKETIVDLPDLAIGHMDIQRMTYDGDEVLWFDLGVINRGVMDSTPFHVDVIFSADEVIGNEDDILYGKLENAYPIDAFGMAETTWGPSAILMTAIAEEFPSGYYYVGILLDSDNEVEESEEDNNIAMTDLTFVGVHSNNVGATSVSIDAAGPLTPDTDVTVAVTVQNLGTSELTAIPIEVVLSSDGGADDVDAVLCSSNETVTIGLNAEVVVNLVCKVSRLRGDFFAVAIVDPDDTLADTDRTDNTVVSDDAVTVVATSPDLVASGTESGGITEIDWGGSLTVSAVVENIGVDDAGPHSVGFYLSSDSAVDESDILLCEIPMQVGLQAGGTETVTETCDSPADAAGTLRLIAMADNQDAVFETDETNNINVSDSIITIQAPDWNLSAGPFSAGSSGIQAGDSVEFQMTVINTGTLDISDYYFEVYLSPDTSIDTGDALFCYQNKGALGAGMMDTFTFSCTTPTVDAGTYYFGLILDPLGALAETDENDNIKVYDLMPVTVQ